MPCWLRNPLCNASYSCSGTSHRLGRNFQTLVCPVELAGLAELKQERNKCGRPITRILAPHFRPGPSIAPDSIVAFFEPRTALMIMHSRSRRTSFFVSSP